jgi:arginine-tRNA-protein transferase
MIRYEYGNCQYLRNKNWRLKLKECNERQFAPSEIDNDLKKGWALLSSVNMRPNCQSCTACKPYRLKVNEFKLSKSFKRVLKKCKDIKVVVKDIKYYDECFDLYFKHSSWRSETRNWDEKYPDRHHFLINFVNGPKCLKQIHFYLNNKLVCVNYLVVTKTTCYSMYTYYDPDYLEYSLGTFAILNGIQHCKDLNFKHLYMGFYIEGCQSLNYKDRFQPSEIYTFATKKWTDYEQ